MTFLKKNWLSIILTAFLLAIFIIPKFGDFVRSKILMKPTLEQSKSNNVLLNDDYDIDLKGINVPNTNLKNFKNKTVFLNFWGTWCPPCRAEWSTIQKLYDNKKDKISFVLVAMQDQEEAVRKFLKDNNYNVPVYLAESPLSEKLLPKVFPTTFVIDKNGKILLKEDSSKDWNSDSVYQFIDKMGK